MQAGVRIFWCNKCEGIEQILMSLPWSDAPNDTDADARFLASSGRQSFASLRAGRPVTLPPPSKEWERDPSDRTDPTNQTRVSFVGAPSTIQGQITEFIAATKADELIAVSHIYDHAARLRSYELAAQLFVGRPPGGRTA